jgi:hypothetical protein
MLAPGFGVAGGEARMNKETNSDWKRLLDELLAETDKKKLETLAQQLENALFLRSQELEAGNGSTDVERQSIKVAIDKLLRVKVEKLGFPMDREFLGRTGGASESQ